MKTIALAVLGVALPSLALAQSPTFEFHGLPVSLHQAQVMALPDLQEQAAAPVGLWRDGFAASPLQVLVLGPRGSAQQEDAVTRTKFARALPAPGSASAR